MSASGVVGTVRRALRELTPTDQFVRAVQRAEEIREAAHNRANADYADRVKAAVATYLPSEAAPNEQPPANQNGAAHA